MVSEYEYITVAELEGYSGIDYSALDATFTDTVIEEQIGIAERICNGIKRGSYTSTTVPDDVEAATFLMSKRLMNNLMIEFGYGAPGETVAQVVDEVIIKMLAALSPKKYDYKLVSDVTSGFFN